MHVWYAIACEAQFFEKWEKCSVFKFESQLVAYAGHYSFVEAVIAVCECVSGEFCSEAKPMRQ